jgi:hypothetical protein
LQALLAPAPEPSHDPADAQSLGKPKRRSRHRAQASTADDKPPVEDGLARRIRAYAEKHPSDTESMVAQVFKCSVEEVRRVLGETPG